MNMTLKDIFGISVSWDSQIVKQVGFTICKMEAYFPGTELV